MLFSIVNILCGIFTLVEFNCENLFDCQHDTLKEDQEFLPSSTRRWTTHRYWEKLDNVGQEIIACGVDGDDWQLPDLVALCEVENDSVCRDLAKRSLLRKAGYEYIVTQSPDVRGIDVALLYSPFTFRLINHRAIRVEPLKNMRPTRDILYASGELRSGDTLHVFIVHAPSRFGGERHTRPHRLRVAEHLSAVVDSVRALNPQAMIVIAGDMNDPHDGHLPQRIEAMGMQNISRQAQGQHGARGTYKHQGLWQSIDHIFASPTLATTCRSCFINDAPFLLEEDSKYGGVMPHRNYVGLRYHNGYSDHLPLVARFEFAQ